MPGPVRRYKLRAFTEHPRDWGGNLYVYPVISRRSQGLSIGINLSPDAVCNFDCIYCQVDRTSPPPRRGGVKLDTLRRELDQMLGWATDGSLFEHPQFAQVPAGLRRINDIAFSGDGEPTTCPQFAAAVELAADLKRAHKLDSVKIVLITNACYLSTPGVVQGLQVMDANQGEIWAKLDAGTEEHFRTVNRPNYSLAHVVESIIHTARLRPVYIQSLWMRIHGSLPPQAEFQAFMARLRGIIRAGGCISQVQLCTIARQPTESFVTPLSDQELDALADTLVAETGLDVAIYHGVDQT